MPDLGSVQLELDDFFFFKLQLYISFMILVSNKNYLWNKARSISGCFSRFECSLNHRSNLVKFYLSTQSHEMRTVILHKDPSNGMKFG